MKYLFLLLLLAACSKQPNNPPTQPECLRILGYKLISTAPTRYQVTLLQGTDTIKQIWLSPPIGRNTCDTLRSRF